MERLHFGSFYGPPPGRNWIHTDVTPHLYIARVPGLAGLLHKLGKMTDARYAEHCKGMFKNMRYLNVTRRWPFANDSFEAVYSSHVLEHLPLHGARICLAESYRCLQSDGVLRILVPDLDAHIRDYDAQNAMEWATNLFEAEERSEKNMHHFMYNFESLRAMLKAAGFSRVMRQNYQAGLCPDVDQLDQRPGSLCVEAVK
jgi:SAM-dependent methyltransferase